MSVAYVLEQNTSLHREGERLLIKRDGEIIHALHLFKLNQVLLFGNVLITPAALAALFEKGIDTVFLSKNGRYRGRLQSPLSKNITLRCEQFAKLNNPEFALKTARYIVAGKLANLRTVLLRINRTRQGVALEDQILKLKHLQQKSQIADDLEMLRGFEGAGAVLYFDGFAQGILNDKMRFRKRIRRPPTDPVNALLSLGYTLLFNSVMAAISMVGFDPYLGSLHAVDYGRPSLALDLMEEWRPVLIDTLVMSVINLKTITEEDFQIVKMESPDMEEESNQGSLTEYDEEDTPATSSQTLPVMLTNSGFRKFLTQFERKMAEKIHYPLTGQQLAYRDCIREQARHFARYLRGEDTYYQPIIFK